jgi:hypothetical protein
MPCCPVDIQGDLGRHTGRLDVLQPYGPIRSVTEMALSSFYTESHLRKHVVLFIVTVVRTSNQQLLSVLHRNVIV